MLSEQALKEMRERDQDRLQRPGEPLADAIARTGRSFLEQAVRDRNLLLADLALMKAVVEDARAMLDNLGGISCDGIRAITVSGAAVYNLKKSLAKLEGTA